MQILCVVCGKQAVQMFTKIDDSLDMDAYDEATKSLKVIKDLTKEALCEYHKITDIKNLFQAAGEKIEDL